MRNLVDIWMLIRITEPNRTEPNEPNRNKHGNNNESKRENLMSKGFVVDSSSWHTVLQPRYHWQATNWQTVLLNPLLQVPSLVCFQLCTRYLPKTSWTNRSATALVSSFCSCVIHGLAGLYDTWKCQWTRMLLSLFLLLFFFPVNFIICCSLLMVLEKELLLWWYH